MTGFGHRRVGSDEYAHLSSVSSPLSVSTGATVSVPNPVHHSNTYPSHLAHMSGLDFRGQSDEQVVSPPTRSVSYQPPGHEAVVIPPRSTSLSSDTPLSVLTQGHQAGTVSHDNAKPCHMSIVTGIMWQHRHYQLGTVTMEQCDNTNPVTWVLPLE